MLITPDLNKPVSTATQTALDLKANSTSLTKAGVGLGNVDNTSDLNKPISTATQTALNLKADLTNIGNFIGATTTPNYFTGFPTNLPSWTCNAGSLVYNGSDYQLLSFPSGGWMFFSYPNENPGLLCTLTVSVKLGTATNLRILIVADPSRFTFDYTTELNTSSYTDLTMNFTPPYNLTML